MLEKIMRLATITSLLSASLTGASLAVELRNTPYLPSLGPSTPPIIGSNNSLNRPAPGTSRCYGSTICRDSGNYISGNGILIYKNGEPLEVHPSTRPPIQGAMPSSNHIQWCSNHYRSYRSSDNTYQPFAGPRQSCNSPFQ
ncbi:BA14K family protein [Brucella sp. BO2]|nr:BA14K family protein [Brucella sp. BO2]CAB4326163.1 BA14K family protein [Brucella sp. 191011898]SCD23749.1 immunoreactive 14 kDa protein BA14k [Brucella inopinata]